MTRTGTFQPFNVPWVVNPLDGDGVTINEPTPAYNPAGAVVSQWPVNNENVNVPINGCALDPVSNVNAWDGRGANSGIPATVTANVTFPRTFAPGETGVFVKSVSLPVAQAQNRSVIEKMVPFAVLRTVPPADAFPPIPGSRSAAIPALIRHMDMSVLPNLARVASAPADLTGVIAVMKSYWPMFARDFSGFRAYPPQRMPSPNGYPREIIVHVGYALCCLCMDYPIEQKRELAALLCWHGLNGLEAWRRTDRAVANNRGLSTVETKGQGGFAHLWKPLMAFARLMLKAAPIAPLLKQACAAPPTGRHTVDRQFGFVDDSWVTTPRIADPSRWVVPFTWIDAGDAGYRKLGWTVFGDLRDNPNWGDASNECGAEYHAAVAFGMLYCIAALGQMTGGWDAYNAPNTVNYLINRFRFWNVRNVGGDWLATHAFAATQTLPWDCVTAWYPASYYPQGTPTVAGTFWRSGGAGGNWLWFRLSHDLRERAIAGPGAAGGAPFDPEVGDNNGIPWPSVDDFTATINNGVAVTAGQKVRTKQTGRMLGLEINVVPNSGQTVTLAYTPGTNRVLTNGGAEVPAITAQTATEIV